MHSGWIGKNQSGSFKKAKDALTLDAPKPRSVAELKRIWSYQKLTNPDHIEITAYKGTEKHVTVPAYIGKLPVTHLKGDAAAFCGKNEIESITFENPDIEFNASLRDCVKLADKDGFIVVVLGDRVILTDYIGESNDIYVPEGVTEVAWDAFGISKDPPRAYSWQITALEIHLPASVQRFNDWNVFSYEWRDLTESGHYCAVHVANPDMAFSCAFPEGRNIIYAPKGSKAEAFARENDIEFVDG